MIEFRDIHRTLAARSVSIKAKEIDQVCSSAAVDLARRSILGAVLVPLCFLMAIFTSGFTSEEPLLCLQLSLIMVTGLLLRATAIGKILSNRGHIESRWLQVLFCGCVFMALAWGLLVSVIMCQFFSGFPLLLILVLSAGIGAGALANLCIWFQLGFVYLVCIFLPAIVTGLWIGPYDLLPALIGMIFFLTYLLLQLRFWNNQYWDSLVTIFLCKLEMERQKGVNSKLQQTLEAVAETRREMRQGRDILRQLLDSMKDGVIVCSLTGEILELNRTLGRLIGVDLDEVSHLSIFELIHPRDSEECGFSGRWERVIHGKEIYFDCWLAKYNTSAFFHCSINMRKITWDEDRVILVSVDDLTGRDHPLYATNDANAMLTRSEGYLQAILQNIKLPIYCKDPDGCYLSVNSHFEKLIDQTEETIIGKKDSEVFPEGVGEFFGFRDQEITHTGEPVELEGTFTIGGQEKNILIHKFPLIKEDDTIYATAGICTDISIMKNALQAAQLASEAKSEFLASVTHELRTPMHSILSFARLGEKRAKRAPREKLESYYSMIIKSGDLLLELLSGLLDLSSLESHHAPYSFGRHNLVTDIEKTVAEFSAMMEEQDIRLSLYAVSQEAWARYDRTKIFQILRNLLSNAMKFSSSGKEICVRIESAYFELEGRSQPVWKVIISDQGIGIAKDELGTVFGKFIQGSKATRGSGGVGLGLAICKRIVEDHQGVIWAEQNEPEGAVFTFVLPVID